ncbi:uncharacterized protein IL334_007660 [Kwoniella shivajii]|uniref:Uncharacterized protein n=1 Tax=Kwoniella shivajii TaxID=564305 RepID=A0ABZ1DD76_9TREE|nr:hypothetical protein IL334_007660 [Kwoniella shivajii]
MSNHTKGRQSLPPMSSNPYSTPTSISKPPHSSSHPHSHSHTSVGNGNQTLILSSTRIKPQPQSQPQFQPYHNTMISGNGNGNGTGNGSGSGLSTSRSLGNLRGSSEGASSSGLPSASKNTNTSSRKKNKKGMKGWAWVVEDENGNIIDAPEEDDSTIALLRQQQQQSETSGLGDGIISLEAQAGRGGTSGGYSASITRSNDKQDKETLTEKPVSRQSNATTAITHHRDGDTDLTSPILSRASTATVEVIPSKRNRKSSSPLSQDDNEAPSPSPAYRSPSPPSPDSFPDKSVNPYSGNNTDSESELSALSPLPSDTSALDPVVVPITTNTNTKVPDSSISDSHTKKRRKTSLPPPAPVPTISTGLVNPTGTATPSTTIPKQPPTANSVTNANVKSARTKTPRTSTTVSSHAPTRTQKALLIREANSSSRAGSQHVVEDDTPLPPPPTRTGMGEGAFPPPKESFLRQESLIRKEAEFIIHSTEQHMVELQKQTERLERNGTIPVSGKRNSRKSVNYNEADNDDDNEDFEMLDDNLDRNRDATDVSQQGRAGPGPSSTSNAHNRRSFGQTYNQGQNRIEQGRSSSTMNFPPPTMNMSFEGQFNQLQKEHKASVLASRASEQSKPPIFNRNARPSVILANGSGIVGGNRSVPRDRTERSYQDGLSGLTNEMESDAQGFVDNVKDNLRAILKYYFPERSPRRDAFCERIGRGLAQMGWELTDDSDAALLP